MKRLSAMIVFVALLGQTGLVDAAMYKDVQKTRYKDAVAYLDQQKIIHGYSDGGIHPYAPINRAETLKILLVSQKRFADELSAKALRPSRMPLFIDVHSTDWFNAYVEASFEMGLVKGYPDGTFKPGKNVTLAEAVSLLGRTQEWNSSPKNGQMWYEPFLEEAKARNLLSKAEKWRPEMVLTRGQLMDIVYRSETVRTQGLLAFKDPEPAPRPIVAAVPYYPVTTVAYRPTATPVYQGQPSSYRPVTYTPTTYRPPVTTTPTTVAQAQPSGGAGFTNVFTISIPALGISNMNVGHPTSTTAAGVLAPLKNGVGQLYGLPGGNSKILVYGHSSGYSWDTSSFTKIFRTINQLKAGDRVQLNYQGKIFTYEVTSQQQIDPKDTSAFSGAGEELILYTCWPPDRIDTRLLVRARRVL